MSRALRAALVFLALLSIWMANPAGAANTLPWVDTDTASSESFGIRQSPSACETLQITNSGAANESQFLFVGGIPFTVQSESDTTGAATDGQANLFACTSASLNSCVALNIVDSDGDGIGDDNTLGDALTGGRGTLRPVTIAGWIYVDPLAAPASGDIQEIIVCRVRFPAGPGTP